MKKLPIGLWLLVMVAPLQAQQWLELDSATENQTVNIYLQDLATGAGKTGISVTGITMKVKKQSATLSSTVTSQACAASGTATDCVEVGFGMYNVEVNPAWVDTKGKLEICGTASGAKEDCLQFEVVSTAWLDCARHGNCGDLASTESTLAAAIAAIVTLLGDPAGADFAADLAILRTATLARTGTAQAGASTTITLDASASASSSAYRGGAISIVSGTGAGQVGRTITAYNGSTKVATVTPSWTTTPSSDSVFVILP